MSLIEHNLSLEQLPVELLAEIFSYSWRLKVLCSLSRTCATFRWILLSASGDHLWRRAYEKVVEQRYAIVDAKGQPIKTHKKFPKMKCPTTCTNLTHWVKSYRVGVPPELRIQKRWFIATMMYITQRSKSKHNQVIRLMSTLDL